jgi:hypothetical protein
MKPKEEETSSAKNGEIWESFRKTLYYKEMQEFLEEKSQELKDSIVQLSMDRKFDEARDFSQKLSGFLIFRDFVEDTISTREEDRESLKEEKEYRKQLPHRL